MFSLKRTPDSEQLLQRKISMAKLFLQSRDYKSAKQHLEEALAIKPNSSTAYKLMSQINEALGENEQASLNYQKFLDLKNSSIDLNSSLESYALTPTKFSSPDTNRISKTQKDVPLANGNDDKAILQGIPTILKTLEKVMETITSNTKEISNLKRDMANFSSKQDASLEKLTTLEHQLNQNNLESKNSFRALLGAVKQVSFDDSNIMKEFEGLRELVQTSARYQDEESFYDEEEDYESTENNAPGCNNQTKQTNLPNLSQYLSRKATWECEACSTHNDDGKNICEACETPRKGCAQAPAQLSAAPIPAFKFGNFAGSGFSFSPSKGDAQPAPQFSLNQPAAPFAKPSGSPFAAIGNSLGLKTSGLNMSGDNNAPQAPQQTKTIVPASNIGLTPVPSFPSTAPAFSFSSALNALPPSNNFSFNLNSASKSTEANVKPVESSSSIFSLPSTGFSFGVLNKATTPPKFSFPTFAAEAKPAEKEEPAKYDVDAMNSPEKDGPEYFKLPNVKLPDNYEQVTGEEEEDVLFANKAKLHVLVDDYKERGTGVFKVLKHKKTAKIRLLMRRDAVHKVCLNVSLTRSAPIKFEKRDKFIAFQCVDFSEDSPKPGSYLLRFSNAQINAQFLDLMNSVASSAEHGDVSSKPTAPLARSQSDNEVTLVYEKKPKPQHVGKLTELKLPPNFYDYEDKADCCGCIGCNDNLDWNSLTKSPDSLVDGHENKHTSGGGLFAELTSEIKVEENRIDDFSPGKTFEAQEQSFVSEKSKLLPEHFEVKTGEEEEEVLLSENAKLYRLVGNEYKERGRGVMKILKRKDKDDYRLLMRRDVLFNVICNQNINLIVGLTKKDPPNTLTWAAVDFSEVPEGEHFNFFIRFKNETIADKFMNLIITNQKKA